MAYFQRIIFILTLSFSSLTFAAAPLTHWEVQYGDPTFESTPDAACLTFAQRYTTAPNVFVGVVSCTLAASNTYAMVMYNTSLNGVTSTNGQYTAGILKYYCAADPTAPADSNTVCAEPPVTCIAGDGPSGYLATNSCLNGCTHVWSGQNAKIGDITYGMYLAKTGGTCSTSGSSLMNQGDVDAAMKAADDKATADAAVAKAAADTKNAADKLAAKNAAADAKAKADKASADKAIADAAAADAKAAADKAAVVNADPSSTQAQKDAANALKTSTQATATTTKNTATTSGTAAATAAGTAASTLKNDPPPEFCTLHPSSIICKNSSVVVGSCSGGNSSGFSCSGDAIQCQIAKEQQAANCKFYEKDDGLKTEYDTLKNGITDNPADTANRQSVSVQNSLTVSHAVNGSCPIDKTFNVNGHSFTLKLSNYCPYLEFLGNVVLILAYLGAAKIIGGSV